MKSKWFIYSIFILIVVVSFLNLNSIPFAASDSDIPEEYSEDFDLNDSYVYNVTQFDSMFSWFDYWTYIGDYETNPGGQIIVNFTGFYAKNPSDTNVISDPVPYINITFMRNVSNSLVLNNTVSNVSSSSAAYALAMSYNNFRPGFLIPVDDFDTLKQRALDQDQTGFWEADVYVRDYTKMIEFVFKKSDNSQNTTIIYDRDTGILVYSKVQSLYGPDLEIFLLGYQMEYISFNDDYSTELDYTDTFIYNVTEFDSMFSWFDYWTYIGDYETNPGGQIIVNFTGFYAKNPSDSNVLSDNVPYINISFIKNVSNSLVLNNTVSNVSSSSAAYALAMSYNDFRPGFVIPVGFMSQLKQQALDQDQAGFWEAEVIIEDFVSLINFTFIKADNSQNTTVIYDKETGILVYGKVQSLYGPDFIINLTGYEFEFTTIQEAEGDLTDWIDQQIYYGAVDNGETVVAGAYSIDSENPFCKLTLESANAHWQLTIVLKDGEGNTISPIETGSNGQNEIWAVYIVLNIKSVTIEITASFSPVSSSVASSGVNYLLKAESSTLYKDYDPYDEIKDKDEPPTSLPIDLMSILSIIGYITIILLLVYVIKYSRK